MQSLEEMIRKAAQSTKKAHWHDIHYLNDNKNITRMNKEELTVEVVDRRLQVNLDEEEGITPDLSKN